MSASNLQTLGKYNKNAKVHYAREDAVSSTEVGFQPGDRDPHRGREPLLDGSRVDISCTQLYYICFIQKERYVILGCYKWFAVEKRLKTTEYTNAVLLNSLSPTVWRSIYIAVLCVSGRRSPSRATIKWLSSLHCSLQACTVVSRCTMADPLASTMVTSLE